MAHMLLGWFSFPKGAVTAGHIEKHVNACIQHIYTRRPLVECHAMRAKNWPTHHATRVFVQNTLQWTETFRHRFPGSLEDTRVRPQRAAFLAGVGHFLLEPAWTRVSHQVS